jgi:hypothetical protein
LFRITVVVGFSDSEMLDLKKNGLWQMFAESTWHGNSTEREKERKMELTMPTCVFTSARSEALHSRDVESVFNVGYSYLLTHNKWDRLLALRTYNSTQTNERYVNK